MLALLALVSRSLCVSCASLSVAQTVPDNTTSVVVEVGVAEIVIRFESPDVELCSASMSEHGANSTACASGSVATVGKDGRAATRCLDLTLANVHVDGAVATIGIEPLNAFGTTIAVTVAAGMFCYGNASSGEVRWRFRTVDPPKVHRDTTMNATMRVDAFSVWGIGIFVSDVASINLELGTFYADISLYILR